MMPQLAEVPRFCQAQGRGTEIVTVILKVIVTVTVKLIDNVTVIVTVAVTVMPTVT